jgi:hypothetical protein
MFSNFSSSYSAHFVIILKTVELSILNDPVDIYFFVKGLVDDGIF